MTIAFTAPISGVLVAQAAAQPNAWGVILLPVALVAVFYFLMIRPAHTQRKRVNEMLKALKVGDKVVTNGGIFGTIAALDDDSVQLRIAEQVKIKIARNAIGGLQTEKKES